MCRFSGLLGLAVLIANGLCLVLTRTLLYKPKVKSVPVPVSVPLPVSVSVSMWVCVCFVSFLLGEFRIIQLVTF